MAEAALVSVIDPGWKCDPHLLTGNYIDSSFIWNQYRLDADVTYCNRPGGELCKNMCGSGRDEGNDAVGKNRISAVLMGWNSAVSINP